MTKFEVIFKRMTHISVVAVIFLIVGFSFFYLDIKFADHFQNLQFKKHLPWLNTLTILGLNVIHLFLLAFIALVFRYIFQNKLWENRVWFLWLCVFIPGVICLFLKILLGRSRPDLWFSQHLYGFYGPHRISDYWSFPSGHTTSIMGLMFGFCAILPQYCLLFILTGTAIALSRVLLVKHYLSDVMFASYLALIEVGLLYYWVKDKLQLDPNQKRIL